MKAHEKENKLAGLKESIERGQAQLDLANAQKAHDKATEVLFAAYRRAGVVSDRLLDKAEDLYKIAGKFKPLPNDTQIRVLEKSIAAGTRRLRKLEGA